RRQGGDVRQIIHGVNCDGEAANYDAVGAAAITDPHSDNRNPAGIAHGVETQAAGWGWAGVVDVQIGQQRRSAVAGGYGEGVNVGPTARADDEPRDAFRNGNLCDYEVTARGLCR